MPIALTNSRTIYRQFRATTRSEMVEAINYTLQAVGWTSTAVTGGYQLRASSPQGYQIYLYIRDLGHASLGNPLVTFNFSSLDGVHVGIDHEIRIDSAWQYQIVCGICYLWLSVVGLANVAGGSSFCGGIPYVPTPGVTCGGEVSATSPGDNIFWASGEGSGDTGPRSNLLVNNTLGASEALWGTDYCAPGNTIGSVRFPVLTPANSISGGFNFPSSVLWRNGDDFVIEPMLAWGLSNSALPKVRAEAYDAMLFSKPRAMDVRHSRIVEGTTYNFVNFTHSWPYGGVSLIVPTSSFIEGNYAYIAT